MAEIEIEHVSKVYERRTPAVRELTLEIHDGELMVLVGPSGCGKTTLLRMVAGLEEITSGELRIAGRRVNELLPRERDIAMVFQNYALFPHMTVFENMAFGLRISRLPKGEIRKRVSEAARILGLEALLERKPRQLSGGQRQRVAMGRAIVRTPRAFLMDEPLSNLDAKLRVQMRAEIARLQSELHVTTVYVTHDQVEAMTMGDRVAVMRRGQLQQVGTPLELFERPCNVFVAGFIGSPAMNLVRARLNAGEERTVAFGSHVLALRDEVAARRPGLSQYLGRELILGVRPQAFEHAAMRPEGSGSRMCVTATLAEVLGTDTLLRFDVDAPPVLTEDMRELAADAGAEVLDRLEAEASRGRSEFVARVDPRARVRAGERVELIVDTRQLHFFDGDTGAAIGYGAEGSSPRLAPAASAASEDHSLEPER